MKYDPTAKVATVSILGVVVTGTAASYAAETGNNLPVLILTPVVIVAMIAHATVTMRRYRRQSLALAEQEQRGAVARMAQRGELDEDEAAAFVGKAHVRLVPSHYFGAEWQCEAGQKDEPVGCERHGEHHWCGVCEGWYGVPHDRIHEGPNAHPYGNNDTTQCACRPCKKLTGRE